MLFDEINPKALSPEEIGWISQTLALINWLGKLPSFSRPQFLQKMETKSHTYFLQR